MADRELLVRIIGDDRDLQKTLSSTDRKLESIDKRTQTFGRNIGRAFAAAGIALGVRELFIGLGNSIAAASALNEEIAKSEQVFGASSSAVQDWATETASSIGVARTEALQATGTFGNLFRVVDIGPEAASEMSQALVQLAADLGSFNNADISDVLGAIRSGLIGEAEPLRRFGVLLSETRVQQQAMAETGKRNVKELTNQEKTLARFNIILSDTAIAQGDFARTSDGLANQSKILRAQLADLSAELGNNLVPLLITATSAVNGLFDAFRAAGKGAEFEIDVDKVDITQLQAVRAEIAGLTGDSHLLVKALDEAIDKILEVQNAGRQDDARAPTFAEQDRRAEQERQADEAAARRDLERRRKAFAELGKGLGLKLDKAQLTKDVDDDIAALRELERAILRQIEAEGKTFKLVEQLTQTRLAINALVQQQADDARQAGIDAFNATLDALNLDLEVAQATKSLADDQAALRALEQAILRRIEAEGANTDLLRQLFQVRQEQADVARQLAEQRRERRQERQFGALGLTEEGERPTPGVGALRRRLTNLREQVKGTTLDTEKTRRELDRIAKVLAGRFGAVGKEVRAAILQMFNDISGALDEGGSRQGPLTKTSGLNTKKIIAGLGLSPEEVAALRGRLAGFNTAGLGLAPSATSTTGGRGGFARGAPIFLESTTTINLDGEQVAKVVTKQQQKSRRRNPRQKRGPNRNI